MQASLIWSYSASAEGVRSSGAEEMVGLIVELESDPVVYHELQARAPGRDFQIESIGTTPDVDFGAASARAHEARLEVEQQDFKSRALQISPNLRVRTELRKLANAVSVEVAASDVAAIAAMPGVKRVEYLKEFHITLDSSVSLINGPAMYERLGGAGVAGNGIKIAILDTGIDISSPLFSDEGFTAPEGFPRFNGDNAGFTNNKVIVAKSFVNDSATANDENGHGTHVAGIATGSLNTISPVGIINGVAPRAYVGNYRVFGKTGSSTTDIIARGLEEAVADGFDVLNLSLGGTAGNTLDFLAQRVEAAVAAGKVVVVSAGNSGAEGEMTIGTPGIAPHAITVAAVTNSHLIGPVVGVTGPGLVPASLLKIGSIQGAGGTSSAVFDDSFSSMSYAYVDSNRGCSALPANSLDGKIALIERGNCNFDVKVNNAEAAGAKGVIIFNRSASEDTPESAPGGENVLTMAVNGTRIPSTFVPRSSGLALRDFFTTNSTSDPALTITPFGTGSYIGDVISSFSSRGPTRTNVLKPDVSAPGEIIYSGAVKSVPEGAQRTVTDPSGFTAINGTSQAAPHVAGAAALIKQLHPSWTPEQIKSALIASATTDVFTNVDKSEKTGILAQGAGRIDVSRAAEVSATFSPANISFGLNKLKKQPVTLNADLTVTSQLQGSNTFNFSVEQLDAEERVTVSLSANSITLDEGQSGTVTFTIHALKKAEKRDYTGYVIITDPTGQTLKIPYWVRYRKKV
jgi:subtilisin family serine protease